ncbi:MAG TPA: acyl carrier protein [Opitutaceae bacterium]|jgi:acyl carrier protein|nr:acyl carrier protein [Opitutaceae bacterium]
METDAILLRTADIIRETVRCGPVAITRATRAMDVRGWDSLSHTMILIQLEDGFGVRLPMDRVLRLGTVGDLVDLIAEVISSR